MKLCTPYWYILSLRHYNEINGNLSYFIFLIDSSMTVSSFLFRNNTVKSLKRAKVIFGCQLFSAPLQHVTVVHYYKIPLFDIYRALYIGHYMSGIIYRALYIGHYISGIIYRALYIGHYI